MRRSIRIVILSGQSEEIHARHARTLGAVEFIGKPADPGTAAQHPSGLLSLGDEGLAPLTSHGGLLGESPPIQKLKAQIAQYAESPFPVLIEGESGTGKDIIASHCLHRLTGRCHFPFLALNCAAISPTLVEPTLFGYAKGAFTGALAAKAGYFEDAGHGTLFLDEIGELPADLQPKLLRVLENGEYQRVGETRVRSARCRVVAATNRDLRQRNESRPISRRPLSPPQRIHHRRPAAAGHGRRSRPAARPFPPPVCRPVRPAPLSSSTPRPRRSGVTTAFQATSANCATS